MHEFHDVLKNAKFFLTDCTSAQKDARARLRLLKPAPIKFEDLVLPRQSHEAKRCKQIRNILSEYNKREKPSSPLSIAVFGPPGSGKSHGVRELLKSCKGFASEIQVNLSQLTDPRQLSAVFLKRPDRRDRKKTKVIFFDEFDATLDGVPLGWLRWFLAPMQDGEFFFEGESIEIGKSVFMFAGGTASTFDEFKRRAELDAVTFPDRKIPDFISRLRGFIDIRGINTPDYSERIVRRALLLDYELRKRSKDLVDTKKSHALKISPDLLNSLLTTVHFVHGARSLVALLDICSLSGACEFAMTSLPSDRDLLRLHLSNGPLDGKTVGISTGLKDYDANPFIRELATEVLSHGVKIAYGGERRADGTLETAATAASDQFANLVDNPATARVRNYLSFPSYLQHMDTVPGVDPIELPALSPSELEAFGLHKSKYFRARPDSGEAYDPVKHVAWAISLFRLRARVIRDTDALVVVGGAAGETWGRFSGIAEETMLAIALGKPVYVLGGRGGAASDVGKLLGLGETMVEPSSCLPLKSNIEFQRLISQNAPCFNLPCQDLPIHIAETRQYLFEHGIGTQFWRWNGLDDAENCELFRTDITKSNWERCVSLILQGLSRLDWRPAACAPLSTGTTFSSGKLPRTAGD